MPRKTYLVCYDICDDKRLKTVFTTSGDCVIPPIATPIGGGHCLPVLHPSSHPSSHIPDRSSIIAHRSSVPDYLPARMLNEFVYCPRLFFYEWVEGVFAHSADTVESALRHQKLETKADPLPPPDTGRSAETARSPSMRPRSGFATATKKRASICP